MPAWGCRASRDPTQRPSRADARRGGSARGQQVRNAAARSPTLPTPFFTEGRLAQMAAHAAAPARADRTTAPTSVAATDAGREAFLLLRLAFTVAPIAMGLDKFFNVLVDWERYLAPWINDILPGSAADAMHVVGVIEIVAGLVVAFRPRWGAPLVAAWLGGIIINLLTYSGFYDIALRDFGLMLGALTLTRLAWTYDRPR